MSNKILLPQLITLLAQESDTPKKQAEAFLKAFFAVLSEALENHESVKVKNFGTFKITRVESRKSVNVSTGASLQIPAHYKVVFTPTKSLADKVNAEFNWLDIVEITDDVSPDLLESEVPSLHSVTSPSASSTSTPSLSGDGERLGEELEKEFGEVEPVEPFGPIDPDDPDLNSPLPDNFFNIMNTENTKPNQSQSTQAEPGNYATKAELALIGKSLKKVRGNVNELEDLISKKSRRNLIVCILVCAALMTGGFFIGFGILSDRIAENARETEEEITDMTLDNVKEQETPVTGDSISANTAVESPAPEAPAAEASADDASQKAAPTQPSDIKAMDKITNTRYLTTMAKEHYGDYNLWPYIYLENQGKIGHPDRIKPGTPIVVPNIEKYGVNPKNPKDIEKAKRLGIEIYSKYKNK